MNKKQAKNLYKVVRALKESKNPETFSMETFTNCVEDPETLIYDERSLKVFKNDWCGTPACAFGHFASRTDLQKICKIENSRHLGLNNEFFHSEIVYADDTNEDLSYDSDRILKYFGISECESDLLFDYEGCNNAKTTKEAILYIENFLKEKGYNPKELNK